MTKFPNMANVVICSHFLTLFCCSTFPGGGGEVEKNWIWRPPDVILSRSLAKSGHRKHFSFYPTFLFCKIVEKDDLESSK